MNRKEYDLESYKYDLPKELIASKPASPRDSSRLLILNKNSGDLKHSVFSELYHYLQADDLLVINDTRVFPARLLGKKETGGKAEIFLLERRENDIWQALVRPSRRLKNGAIVNISDSFKVEILARMPDHSREVRLIYKGNLWQRLEEVGHTPLPIYIDRPDDDEDRIEYQTIYADQPGAVAAPTAGLHFTEDVFNSLEQKGIEIARITLHVGWGTFRMIEAENIRDHNMHSEIYSISTKAAEQINRTIRDNRRVVAVGTTTVRTLESAAKENLPIKPGMRSTNLFIYPGYEFKITGAMITNFHLPGSSLIVMVSAFAGRDKIMKAYKSAIEKRYRFYSYGDAMLIQ